MLKRTQFYLRITVFLFPLIPVLYSGTILANQCSYSYYKWNVYIKKAIEQKHVVKDYSELSVAEIDIETGCSVCEQDQEWVNLPGLKPFRICKYLSSDVENVLHSLIEEGFPIKSIVAYRPGKTRGDIDEQGNRTKFSNHSFGIALDINSEKNGLYDQCIQFGPHCRLIRGGPWKPGVIGTLTPNGPVVRQMKKIGLQWGGEIIGKQKDFMHFSPKGY